MNKEKEAQYKREYHIEYRKTHKEKLLQYKREWRKNNREKCATYLLNWISKNRDQYNMRKREYQKRRYAQSHKYRLNNSVGVLIWMALKGKKAGVSWQKLVGYSIDDLIKYLEKQFDNKMNWENYGSYWWIDHIKPRSLFKFETSRDTEFEECWALENLRPLEKTANMKKHNKYEVKG